MFCFCVCCWCLKASEWVSGCAGLPQSISGHTAFRFIVFFFLSNFLFNADLSNFKPVVIKEGCSYRIKIVFRVQREIVSGLRYSYGVFRKGIRGNKTANACGLSGIPVLYWLTAHVLVTRDNKGSNQCMPTARLHLPHCSISRCMRVKSVEDLKIKHLYLV